MNTINLNLEVVSKSIRHALNSGASRRDQYFMVAPHIRQVRDAYRDYSRSFLLKGC